MFILHYITCDSLGCFYSIIQKILRNLHSLGEEIALC